MTSARITSSTVRDDFNSLEAVLHYTRAAVSLGLWESERLLIERFFIDRTAPLIEAGCGAGRATLGLWALGYRNLTAFDFAEELLEQAVSLAAERSAHSARFFHADATRPLRHQLLDYQSRDARSEGLRGTCQLLDDKMPPALAVSTHRSFHNTAGPDPKSCKLIDDKLPEAPATLQGDEALFAGALFLFNGLTQIPARENRRAAMRNLHGACREGAPFIFTTHDRDDSQVERALWAKERAAWKAGTQDPRLVEFGDRYMESTEGRIFMHLPDQAEIQEDLATTGWELEFTAMRREIARESRAVREFSDECRFWVARKE
jgi:SAM-dependent methyltransferase